MAFSALVPDSAASAPDDGGGWGLGDEQREAL